MRSAILTLGRTQALAPIEHASPNRGIAEDGCRRTDRVERSDGRIVAEDRVLIEEVEITHHGIQGHRDVAMDDIADPHRDQRRIVVD